MSTELMIQNIKFLKNKHHYSQQNIADKIGCNRQLVGSWLELRSLPNTNDLKGLSDLFKISIDDLCRIDLSTNVSTYPKYKKVQKLLSA